MVLQPRLPALTCGSVGARGHLHRIRPAPGDDPALIASGLALPARRITVNLAPAALRKEGPGFDLAKLAGELAVTFGNDGRPPVPGEVSKYEIDHRGRYFTSSVKRVMA